MYILHYVSQYYLLTFWEEGPFVDEPITFKVTFYTAHSEETNQGITID